MGLKEDVSICKLLRSGWCNESMKYERLQRREMEAFVLLAGQAASGILADFHCRQSTSKLDTVKASHDARDPSICVTQTIVVSASPTTSEGYLAFVSSPQGLTRNTEETRTWVIYWGERKGFGLPRVKGQHSSACF